MYDVGPLPAVGLHYKKETTSGQHGLLSVHLNLAFKKANENAML